MPFKLLPAYDSTTSFPPDSIQYDVSWVENTFHSRAVTQSLLAQQRENLSIHDYDAAMQFLPGIHPYYGIIGTGTGGTLAYVFARRRWNSPRTGLFVLFGGILGNSLGIFARLKAHIYFVESVQNPEGFNMALANIRKDTNFRSRGPVILRYSMQNQSDNANDASYIPVAPDVNYSHPVTPQKQKYESKWDELRATNGHATKRSSWETLRQQHERHHTLEKPETRNNGFNGDKDKPTEQEEFNALLEKERNFK